MPESFVTPVTSEGMPQQLNTIRQVIMSRTRLEQVIEKLDPYPEMTGQPSHVVVESMRRAIELRVQGNDSFVIGYVNRDPYKAMMVTNMLASQFTEDAGRLREALTRKAYDFIQENVADARRALEEREEALRRHKQRYWGSLPEQLDSNLRMLQQLQAEQQTLGESLRTLPGGGLLADSVTSVAPWGDDVAYVGTRAGVAQIDVAGEVAEYNEESSRRRGVDGFPDAAVLDVAADETWVWAALTTGVVRYRRLPPHDVEVLRDSLVGSRAHTVVRQHGQIWVGTDRGVHVWDEASRAWRLLRYAAGVPQPTPTFNAYSIVVRQPDALHPVVAAGSDADMWTYNGFAWSRCNPPPLPWPGSRGRPGLGSRAGRERGVRWIANSLSLCGEVYFCRWIEWIWIVLS